MFQSSVDMDKKIEKEQQVYKRIQLLGTGSYGKAYLVKQIKTDQLFVIKQILIADMNPQQQQNALREAKILQALSHPNIVRFKEVYRTSKMRLNIVMQYADEGDLANKIKEAKKQNKYFEEAQILDWFTQICLGIKHIHDRKIIHRDLKAQNIFLAADKIVKIGDFGVSRVLEQTAMNARTVVGSPYYLSPQIIQNKPYSFQTDIWSLGTLLYEMCALGPPFVANNLQFLALKIVKGAYGQIPNHYSYELKSLIKSMLNTDSSRRPNINKILTSKIISRRISSFLTESKRIDEFSHTVIHNKNILQNNLAKNQKSQQKSLLPPPNLINIENQMENRSEICTSNVNFQIDHETKSRPFTPLIGQNRKGPNNFFNNNKKPIKKLQGPSNINMNFNDLIKIKPSALQEKVKLPRVNTNISLFDRKQSQVQIRKNDSEMFTPQRNEKPILNSAFQKKRVESKDIASNKPVGMYKRQEQKKQTQEVKEQGIVGKWKKPPRNLQKILPTSSRISPQKVSDQYYSQEQIIGDTKKREGNINKTEYIQRKEEKPPSVKRSQSTKRVICAPKKSSVNIAKKQTQKVEVKKNVPKTSKNTSRKQSVSSNAPVMQIVSEQMKKKGIEEKQKGNKSNKSSSKREKEIKKVLQKKSNVPSTQRVQAVNVIRKVPSQKKVVKKTGSSKGFQKLAQPPRLEFQTQQELESPQKEEERKESQRSSDQEEVVEEQKYNSDQEGEEKEEEMYQHEGFEEYEENYLRNNQDNQEKECQDRDQQVSSQGSLNFSDSCKPPQGKSPIKENFNKMLDELQVIKNMIAMANGVIDTLPVLADEYNGHNLLQLSTTSHEVIREDDSDLDSVIGDKRQMHEVNPNENLKEVEKDNPNGDSNNKSISQKINQNSSFCSNSSNSSSCQGNFNLNVLSNQEHLETLKMNLEELFGENNVIFIHRFISEIIEEEGLDFNEKDIQNMILFQKPQINPTLLKKYFRLIVTVVIMEQQQNFAG